MPRTYSITEGARLLGVSTATLSGAFHLGGPATMVPQQYFRDDSYACELSLPALQLLVGWRRGTRVGTRKAGGRSRYA